MGGYEVTFKATLCWVLILSGCSTATRSMSVGSLNGVGDPSLVILTLSSDLGTVTDACSWLAPAPSVAGCAKFTTLESGVKLVTVVRYVDVLPSERSHEIEAHELCHVVAQLQKSLLDDPCHNGNHGVL